MNLKIGTKLENLSCSQAAEWDKPGSSLLNLTVKRQPQTPKPADHRSKCKSKIIISTYTREGFQQLRPRWNDRRTDRQAV